MEFSDFYYSMQKFSAYNFFSVNLFAFFQWIILALFDNFKAKRLRKTKNVLYKSVILHFFWSAWRLKFGPKKVKIVVP